MQPHRWYMHTCLSVSLVYQFYLAQIDLHRLHSWAVRFNLSLGAFGHQGIFLGALVLVFGLWVSGVRYKAVRGWCVSPRLALAMLCLASPRNHLGRLWQGADRAELP